MLRKLSFILIALLSLAGCTRNGGPAERLMLSRDYAVQDKPPSPPDQSQIFSFSHSLTLLMGHEAVKTRYDMARESCLHDASLHCKLQSASLDEAADGASAHLEVALPHDRLAAFEAHLLKPEGDVEVRSRSTRAESVENQASDTDKKIAQLGKYRDGLAELAKRPNLSVDDFIKVQSELSKTEADLDEALAQKRDIALRIARELLSVDLEERVTAASPLGQVWSGARDMLVYSTADVLRFLIQMVPWLPVIVAVFFLVRWLWRIARRRPDVAKSAEINSGG
jgi:hypothetical protein